MAMPRRELFSVSGFTTRIEMRVLDSLRQEHWFAQPATIAEDVEAKQVCLGLLLRQGGSFLVDCEGLVLHRLPVPAEAGNLGSGLTGLRALARLAANRLLGREAGNPQLIGYLNEDRLKETRPFFIMVYQGQAGPAVEAPAGMVWMSAAALREVPLELVSALVCAELEA